MANSRNVALKGSERAPLTGARVIGRTDPHQLIEISVLLKHRQPLETAQPSSRFIDHNQFATQFGADPAHVDKLRQFARDNKLQMLERGDEVLRRTVTLAGTASQMEKAFGVELNEYEHPDGSYRGRTGAIQIPEEYADIIQGVFGLDDRPVAKPHFRYRNNDKGTFGARASNISYTPAEVGKLYNFPQDATGAGQVIGLIELGGGYRPADVQQYFQSLGLQAPVIKTASVNSAKNRPSTANSADGEVMLDIEVAGAVAPGAMLVVYFAPNTSRGFQDALSMAVHDQLLGPRVISISWGGPESTWTQQSLECLDQVAQEAGLLGISITVAAGDNGSSDGVNDGKNHVDFPASCPHVLACGGTRLMASNGSITSESVWNDGPSGGATGGGFSTVFSLPAWQANAIQGISSQANTSQTNATRTNTAQTGASQTNTSQANASQTGTSQGHTSQANASQAGASQSGTTQTNASQTNGSQSYRGVPDVSGNADPETGYDVLVDGQQMVIGGTSAVAPLWAGLIALLCQKTQTRIGFLNPALYNCDQSTCFREITSGNNGAFSARQGWSAAAGLGTPIGGQLLQAQQTAASQNQGATAQTQSRETQRH